MMKINFFKITVLSALLFGIAGSGSVLAQDIFDDSSDVRQQVSVKLPEVEFGQENEYFTAVITLQKQIALIKKLKDREDKINNIITSYDNMGVSFDPPAPERDLCEQIPPNKVCHSYYKGMYRNYNPDVSVKKEETSEVQNIKLPTGNDVAVDPVLDIPKQLSEQTPEEKQALKKSRFAWTKITCLETACKAVIAPTGNITDKDGNPSDAVDEKFSYSVRPGDVLPSGAVITRISVDGVETSSGGKTDIIGPAPANKDIAQN